MNTNYFLNDIKDTAINEIIAKTQYIAVGTGTTTATISDTSLDNEILRKARQSYTQNTNSVVVSMWIGTSEANGSTLSEVGVFDASSGGNLLTRDTFTGLTKDNNTEVWIDLEEDVDITQ